MAPKPDEAAQQYSRDALRPPASPTPPELVSPPHETNQLSLSQAINRRRPEFTVKKNVTVKIGSWNVAALNGPELDLGGWFVQGQGVSERLSGVTLADELKVHNGLEADEKIEEQEERRTSRAPTIPKNDPGTIDEGQNIGLYVLGLQEVVDVSSALEAFKPVSDPSPSRKWKLATESALPKGYSLVAEQQLIGMLILIYASPEVGPLITSVSATNVGTGLLGYVGNKGAVGVRLVLGETSRLLFINSHLTAGAEKGSMERRNWDFSQISTRAKFDKVENTGRDVDRHHELVGDEDFTFWFGDLNYRLDGLPGADVRHLLMLHTNGEYGRPTQSETSPEAMEAKEEAMRKTITTDITSIPRLSEAKSSSPKLVSDVLKEEVKDASEDPTDLQSTLSSLLTHDQLRMQMRERKAFADGWREGPLNFLPTYKYDVGSVGVFDSSEKRRGPSWCDRILYRTRKDQEQYKERIKGESLARQKDSDMTARGVVDAASDEAVLFDYDPETDGVEDEQTAYSNDSEGPVGNGSLEDDSLVLEYYTSHQRVLSSDHKPLVAVFTLIYDAIDVEKKALIHHEVAKELDQAENESRPVVTIVQDRQGHQSSNEASSEFPSTIEFGDISYRSPISQTFTIANTGSCTARVGFIDSSEDAYKVTPSWLNFGFDRPSDNSNNNPGALRQYTLKPGDIVNVELIALIQEMDLVQRLNSEHELKDILVLRVYQGRDFFLPVHAIWLPTCFGRSIEELLTEPESGCRDIEPKASEGSNGQQQAKRSAPQELFHLTSALEKTLERATSEYEMRYDENQLPWIKDTRWPFAAAATSVDELEVYKAQVREALDCNKDLQKAFGPEVHQGTRVEAIAATLIEFLASIADRVVPMFLWQKISQRLAEHAKAKKSGSHEENQSWVLDILSESPPHSVSFTLVVFMLSHLVNDIAAVPRNTSVPERRRAISASYISIFSLVLVRQPAELKGKARKLADEQARQFLGMFLSPE